MTNLKSFKEVSLRKILPSSETFQFSMIRSFHAVPFEMAYSPSCRPYPLESYPSGTSLRLTTPLAGRVSLIGKNLYGVHELDRLLVEGQLVLLDGYLSLKELQLRDPDLIVEPVVLILVTIAQLPQCLDS